MSALSLATSVPVMPIATPILARLIDGASLTPSPVIATTSPSSRSASTMRILCSGATRANTSVNSTCCLSCSSVKSSSSAPLRTWWLGFNSPIASAIARAVLGKSPVIMIVRMPALAAFARAGFTSGRAGSIIPTKPTKISPSSNFSRSSVSGRVWLTLYATPSTRKASWVI